MHPLTERTQLPVENLSWVGMKWKMRVTGEKTDYHSGSCFILSLIFASVFLMDLSRSCLML